MTSNPTITILHQTAFPCASAEPEKARVNRPGRGVGRGGSVFTELEKQHADRQTGRLQKQLRVQRATRKKALKKKKKKKRRRNGIESRRLEGPRVLGERKPPANKALGPRTGTCLFRKNPASEDKLATL